MAEKPPDPADLAIDQIVLDIQAVGRAGWDASTEDLLRDRLVASHDPDVKRFLAALQPRRQGPPWGLALIGIGELVLGALLTVGGFVLVVPAILGFTTRGEIARYLSDLALGLSSSGMSDPLLGGLGFAIALFLILVALYTLRQASRNLRQSGLVPPSS